MRGVMFEGNPHDRDTGIIVVVEGKVYLGGGRGSIYYLDFVVRAKLERNDRRDSVGIAVEKRAVDDFPEVRALVRDHAVLNCRKQSTHSALLVLLFEPSDNFKL
jgi:hypothetical protein